MADAPLAFEPGSHWLYGFSSELAAGIIEAVCEKPVNEALRDMIFDPLEMNDTGDIFFGDISDRMVKLYVKKEGWFSWKTGLPSLMKSILAAMSMKLDGADFSQQ